jgi:hypothetical protein
VDHTRVPREVVTLNEIKDDIGNKYNFTVGVLFIGKIFITGGFVPP